MTTIILLITALASLMAIVVPWIGVVAYYAMSISQPQGFYPWEFESSRSSLIITAATMLGLVIAIAMRKVDFRVLLSKQNILFSFLILWINLAYQNSDFNDLMDPISEFSPEFILGTINKIAVFYFFAVLLIDDKAKLITLLYMFAIVALFYTFWANKVYFTGEFWRFGDNGRLNGPPNSIYYDENYLAMIFVLATPVFYYLGVSARNVVLKYGMWLIIPLAWHGLFLTGSRGGLLSLSVVCIYIFFRSYSKVTSYGIVVGLVLAVIFQSGNLITRVDDTIEKNEIETEEALDPRLISWQIGFKIIQDYPTFGVGVGNFINAFSNYSDTQPHVAHNTFLQFSADNGIIPGIIYLYFFYARFRLFLKNSARAKESRNDVQTNYLDDLINCLFLGFFVIAIFLDLMLYEHLYFLLVLSYCKYIMDNPFKTDDFRINVDNTIYRNSTDTSIYDQQETNTDSRPAIPAMQNRTNRDDDKNA